MLTYASHMARRVLDCGHFLRFQFFYDKYFNISNEMVWMLSIKNVYVWVKDTKKWIINYSSIACRKDIFKLYSIRIDGIKSSIFQYLSNKMCHIFVSSLRIKAVFLEKLIGIDNEPRWWIFLYFKRWKMCSTSSRQELKWTFRRKQCFCNAFIKILGFFQRWWTLVLSKRKIMQIRIFIRSELFKCIRNKLQFEAARGFDIFFSCDCK